MSIDKDAALWLVKGLSNKAFAEFFYEAVSDRDVGDCPEMQGHFVLGRACTPEGNREWDVDLVGVADKGVYDGEWADDSPICQSGTCMNCDKSIFSWAKHSICPICGEAVYCT